MMEKPQLRRNHWKFLSALHQQHLGRPKGALLTNSFAIEHPSEPNYLDVRLGKNL